MAVVRQELSPELAALGFIGTAPVRMTFRLRDGRTIHGARDIAIGNPECPHERGGPRREVYFVRFARHDARGR